MNFPTVGVVIASVGRPADLRVALTSVRQQDDLPDEVIVVAQRSDEATILAAHSADVRVVLVDQAGLALAIETGIRGSSTDVVAFLDDDARARPNWIAAIRATFAADTMLGLLGGRDNVDGDDKSQIINGPVGVLQRGRIIGNHHLGTGELRYVTHVKGANMSMRRVQAATVPLAALVTGAGAQVRNEFVLSLAFQRMRLKVAYDPRIQVDHYPATRLVGDERIRIDSEKTFVRRSNEAAALTFGGTLGMTVAYMFRAVFVGERIAPGLVIAILDLKRGRSVGRLLWAGFAGLVDGGRRGRQLRRRTEVATR